MSREHARRSRGGGRRVAARHRKAGESSGAWPYSDVFIWERGWVSEGQLGGMCYGTARTSSNFAFPEDDIFTGWMPSSPVVESKKRRKVWCGWTPLSVSCSATWKVSFRVSLGPSVTGSGRFLREILLRLFHFVRVRRKYVSRTALSSVGSHHVQRRSNEAIEQ